MKKDLDNPNFTVSTIHSYINSLLSPFYLLGDRIQQIYRNYDGSFEEEFKTFDTTQKLDTNHRSAGQIVAILNKIYNDVNYDQQPSKDNKDCKIDIMPQIMISSNVEESVSELQKKFPGILVLYLMNQEKYKEIGAGGLYRCYNSMETYSRTKKNTVTDVLSDISNENPDPLMKLLFIIYNIMKQYFSNHYGAIISLCKMQKQIFNASHLSYNIMRTKRR